MENFNCIRQEANVAQIKKCRLAIAERNSYLENLSEHFQLAGNAVRLKILYLLHLEKKLCVCDLSDILQMSVPAVSQHLRKLKDRKMIYTQRSGQIIFYALHRETEDFVKKLLDLSLSAIEV